MHGFNQLMWQFCRVCVAILQWLNIRGARTAIVQGSDSDRLWLWLQLGFGNQAAASLSSLLSYWLSIIMGFVWSNKESKCQSLSGFLGYLSVSVSFTHMTCVHTEAHWHTSGSPPPHHTHTRHTYTDTPDDTHTHTLHYTVTLTHTDSTSDRCWHTLALIYTHTYMHTHTHTHTHTQGTHTYAHTQKEKHTLCRYIHTPALMLTHTHTQQQSKLRLV